MAEQLTYIARKGHDAEFKNLNIEGDDGFFESGIVNKIVETVAFGAFTDGGSTAGTFILTKGTIPVGATVLRAVLTAIVGFAGDTSATIQVGDETDADRYSTGTPDVFTTIAAGLDLGVASGVAYHAAAKNVELTVTVATDWGGVTAGSVTVEIYYMT